METPEVLPEAAEVEKPPEPEVQAPEVDEQPDPEKLRSEIAELEAKRQKAEEDAARWRREKAEARADYFKSLQGMREEQPPPPQPKHEGAPQETDFENYSDYVQALTDYKVKQARTTWEADQITRQRQIAQQQRLANLHQKLAEGSTAHDDFEEVVYDRTASHITPMVVDILADSDNPAEVAYYLAKNRIEGVKISRMTPIQAARAIAKIETQLNQPAANPPKKTTKAPPPITPIGSSGSAALTKDPDKMSPKEFAEWRISQGARRF